MTAGALDFVRCNWPAGQFVRWNLQRLRHLADIRPSNVDKKSVNDEVDVQLCNYTDVYYHDAITADMNFMPATAPVAQVKRFQLLQDDVLVTKDSETPADIAIAAHVRDELPGVLCGYHLAILRPLHDVGGRFLAYALQSRPLAAQTEVAASGVTRFALSRGALADLTLPVPGRGEQLAIADFLDRETEKIDALVAKKQQLIDLLQGKRTALISHAVTKGLDPDVPMKDSGIEWLGGVPARWKMMRLKHILRNIIDTEHKTVPFVDGGAYVVARTTDIRGGQLLAEQAKRTDESSYAEWTRRGRPEQGDVMFTREAPAGEACVVPPEPRLCLGQRVVLLRLERILVDGTFLVHSLYSGLAHEFITLLSQGTTVSHFNMSDIGNIPVLLPPIAEQQAIVEHVTDIALRIEELVSRVSRAIDALGEYRSALVTAAVTGQIDVGAR